VQTRRNANEDRNSLGSLVDERVRAAETRLEAKLVDQDRVIVELERRVRALEEALRLLSSGVKG
jgi:hypothetical protein